MSDAYGKALKDIKEENKKSEEPALGDSVFQQMHKEAKDPKNYNSEALKKMKEKGIKLGD